MRIEFASVSLLARGGKEEKKKSQYVERKKKKRKFASSVCQTKTHLRGHLDAIWRIFLFSFLPCTLFLIALLLIVHLPFWPTCDTCVPLWSRAELFNKSLFLLGPWPKFLVLSGHLWFGGYSLLSCLRLHLARFFFFKSLFFFLSKPLSVKIVERAFFVQRPRRSRRSLIPNRVSPKHNLVLSVLLHPKSGRRPQIRLQLVVLHPQART